MTVQTIDTPIIQVLENLSSGALFDLSAQVSEAVQTAQDTGKMATVTLTLKFKPQGAGRMEVVDDISSKLPRYPRQTTLMYADGGMLLKDDPKQQKLNLRTVETQPTKFKEVK